MVARGADALVWVMSIRYFYMFIVSVKRLVRFWTFRDPGCLTHVGESLRVKDCGQAVRSVNKLSVK